MINKMSISTISNLHKNFLQQNPPLMRSEATFEHFRSLAAILRIGQIKEQVEAFDECGWKRGRRHTVDEACRAVC